MDWSFGRFGLQKTLNFLDDWSKGNPCEEVWSRFKGPVTLGSLFWMADQQMPGRLWLSEDLRKVVADVEQDNVTRMSQCCAFLRRGVRESQGDPGNRESGGSSAHAMNTLALEAGYRDAGALERLLISQLQFEDHR